MIKWKTTSITIQEGQKFILPINIEENNQKLVWSFNIFNFNILFSVIIEYLNGNSDYFIFEREISRGTEESEMLVPCDCRKIYLIWDNSYSWYTEKIISYSIYLSKDCKMLESKNSGE